MRFLTKYLDAALAITCRDASCSGNSVPQPVVLDSPDHRLADENYPGMPADEHEALAELRGVTRPRSLESAADSKRRNNMLATCIPPASQIDNRLRRACKLSSLLADELQALAALRTAEASLQVAEAAALGLISCCLLPCPFPCLWI